MKAISFCAMRKQVHACKVLKTLIKEERKVGKKVLSIEIGLHQTRVCEVEAGKKNPHVSNCITFETPENIVEDGFVLDKDLMAQTLKTNLSSAKMNTKDVIFTITSTKIANREVVIPLVADNKIQSIIDASATEYFPLDVSEYTISYSILEKINTKEEKKIKLLLLAAPNNLVKNIYGFAEVAGLHIYAIDYIGNSAYQLLKKQVGTGVNVSVQINDQTTLVNVMENESLSLQRTIPYGAMNIVSAILDNPIFGKTNSREAMQLLMQENIINSHVDMAGEISPGLSIGSDDYDRVMREIRGREDVTSTIQYIMNNVNRVLDYYMSRNSEKRINAIYLTGVGAKFKGIEVLFTNETGYDVKKIDSLFAVSFAKGLQIEGNQADYLTVIGASIAPVGFIPAEVRAVEDKTGNSKTASIVFAASCALAAVLIVGSAANYQIARFKHGVYEKQIEDKKYIEDVYATHQSAKEAYEYTSYMYSMTSNRNFQLNELKEKIASVMPSNMKVLSLTSNDTELSLNIEATSSKVSVSELLIQLKQIPSISSATVANLVEEVGDNGDSDKETFTVICGYNPFHAEKDEKVSLKDEVADKEDEDSNDATGNTDTTNNTEGQITATNDAGTASNAN